MMYLLALIVMLSTGICYSVAKRKHLSIQLWVALGVLFGPFAIPFLFFARPGPAESQTPDVSLDE